MHTWILILMLLTGTSAAVFHTHEACEKAANKIKENDQVHPYLLDVFCFEDSYMTVIANNEDKK